LADEFKKIASETCEEQGKSFEYFRSLLVLWIPIICSEFCFCWSESPNKTVYHETEVWCVLYALNYLNLSVLCGWFYCISFNRDIHTAAVSHFVFKPRQMEFSR
jgi:hypothetical protein